MDDHLGEDPETRAQRRNMWKEFGRDTKAGKMLFDLYKSHEPPRINYPKPKPKSEAERERDRQKGLKPPPPQQAQVSYPRAKSTERATNLIDLVPHKKNQQAIDQEKEAYRREFQLPAYRPSHRAQDKLALQQKFGEGRGALPKGAEMPPVQLTAHEEAEIKASVLRKLALRQQRHLPRQQAPGKSRKDQLNDLFEQVCL
jgi:hypothetical protein